MERSGSGGFAFLYQSEKGVVDRETWFRAAWPLAAVYGALTLVWFALKPYAARGLDKRAFLDPMALVANLYLLAYAFAAILIAISWVNLGAKRFRDRGRKPPVGLAGVFPLAALLDGALRWLQPQMADALPMALVWCGDALLVAALAWTVAECADLIGA